MRHGIVRFIKTWKQEILLAFIAIVSVWGSVQLISASLRVHLDELEINLQNSNFMDGGVSHLPLVARFEQQRRLLNDSISKQQLDSSELQMAALSMNSSTKSNQGIEASNASEFISVYIINGLRKIMGKPPLPEMNVTKTIDNLDLAFYYERTKQYKKALLLYDQILQHDIPMIFAPVFYCIKAFAMGCRGILHPLNITCNK
jgi:hypothetical protein